MYVKQKIDSRSSPGRCEKVWENLNVNCEL